MCIHNKHCSSILSTGDITVFSYHKKTRTISRSATWTVNLNISTIFNLFLLFHCRFVGIGVRCVVVSFHCATFYLFQFINMYGVSFIFRLKCIGRPAQQYKAKIPFRGGAMHKTWIADGKSLYTSEFAPVFN